MKKSRKISLVVVSAFLFAVLFYKQGIAFNFGLLGLITLGIIHFLLPANRKDRKYYLLAFVVGVTSLSQMWYGDEYAFFALFFSLLMMGIYIFFRKLNFIFYPLLMGLNYFIFIYRFLSFDWFPIQKREGKKMGKKIIVLVLFPALISILFILVYSTGSDLFYNFTKQFKINENTLYFFGLFLIGFFFYFNYWYLWIPRFFITFNARFKEEFGENNKTKLLVDEKIVDVDLQRSSGVISLAILNAILLFFIGTYNYEQFFTLESTQNLSADTHTQVNTIIFSIILAMGVILFYFNSYFNFDNKATNLRKLSYLWLVLNSLLVASAIVKTMEYVGAYGLTMKRVGVFIFLFLCLIGMYYSYVKISQKKTNAFLVNKMAWVFFLAFTLNSPVNYSWLVTQYNLSFVEDQNQDINYLFNLRYNKRVLHQHLKENEIYLEKEHLIERFERKQTQEMSKSILSQSFYYRCVDLND